MAHESAFVREVLRDLAARTEADASRFPQMRHMLVLPAGEEIRIPGVAGGRGIREFRDKTTLKVQAFGRSRVVGPLPPESAWPKSSKPFQAIVAEQASVPFRASSQRPYRIHLFFGGSRAALAAFQRLADELAEMRADITKAMYGKSSPFADGVFFSNDSLHDERIVALDSWLCTMHWWHWTWTDSPFRTQPQIVHADKAYVTTREDDAVKSKLSFSLIDVDVLTASATTINLILRFFDEPPAMFWSADYPDIPKPERMRPPDVADLAARFIGYVTNYLQWQKTVNLISAAGQPNRPGMLPDSGFADRLLEADRKKFQAAAQIRRYGPALAAGLERFGCDSKGVLSIVHCAGPGGGGPDYVLPGWEATSVALQQAAIRLRGAEFQLPDTAAATVGVQVAPVAELLASPVDASTPAAGGAHEAAQREPSVKTTTAIRSPTVLESIARKFDGYAAIPSPNDLVEMAGRSGDLLHAARQAGAFDVIVWDELNPCFRLPQTGAPQNDGRVLLNCVTHRLAKSTNAAAVGLKFVPEPPHPQKSYDVDWLRQTFARLAALVRSEGARLTLPEPAKSEPAAPAATDAKVTPPFEVPVAEWLSVTGAAEKLMEDVDGLKLRIARARVSLAAGQKLFRTNGKTRNDRRIDPVTFKAWRLDQRDRNLNRENAGH